MNRNPTTKGATHFVQIVSRTKCGGAGDWRKLTGTEKGMWREYHRLAYRRAAQFYEATVTKTDDGYDVIIDGERFATYRVRAIE